MKTILPLLLLLLLCACEAKPPQNAIEENKPEYPHSFIDYLQKYGHTIQQLNCDSIDNIKVIQQDSKDTLPFSKHATIAFVNHFNLARPIGPCKYFPSHEVIVKMKNGSQRTFRVNGPCIKESDDHCLQANEDFFSD